MSTDTTPVLVTVQGGVMHIVLNRPDKRNAVNREVSDLIAEALDQYEASPEIGAAVISGSGAHFCAGLDLKAFAAGKDVRNPERGFAGIVEQPPTKPLIGAAEGWALGGGLEILLSCDLIVASTTANFGLPEVKRGLVARGGGAMRIAEALPRKVALEMLMTGEPMSAERAHHFGLVNRVTDEGGATQAALELARLIAGNAPLATAASKRIINESASWDRAEAFAIQREILEHVFQSEDAKEGAKAFGEKREPVWQGK